MTDEQVKKAVEVLEKMSPEQRDDVRLTAYGVKVNSLPVGVQGFGYFYWCIYKRFIPKIAERIVEHFVKAFYDKSGVMVQSWRGFGKSTLLTAWSAYLVGKRPVGSTAIVRINDGSAQETGKAVATIIEENNGWRACFPNVVPDKDKGWSTDSGYFIWDKTIDHGKWVQQTLADHVAEPSLLCAGISSGALIGKHPTNGMWIDDLHDEGNTRSAREMKAVVDILTSNIIPTWNSAGGQPTVGVVCTPWSDKDAYSAMLATGKFKLVKIPIFERDDLGVKFDPFGVNVKPMWPEIYPIERIYEIWKENPVQFPRMYLCDLELMKGTVLRREWLHEYPLDKINSTWPVYFGIDFASTEDKLKSDDRDYFALSVGVGLPGGGMVVVDGFRDKIPTQEALNRVRMYAAKYPTLDSIGVEKWGKGEEFKTQLLYGSGLTIIPCPHKGAPVKSKGQRYQTELAPMFTTGRLWLSDVKNDFLRAFEDEWIGWDGGKSRTGHDDCLDAVYWTCYIGQSHLMPNKAESSLPVNERARIENPFNSLGDKHAKVELFSVHS